MGYTHTARGGDQNRALVNTVMNNWAQLDRGQFIDRSSDSQRGYLTNEVFTPVLIDIKFYRDVPSCKLVNSYRRFGGA